MHTASPSISAFFPCYNDAGTIATMVTAAGDTLRRLTDDFEVIVVNDGSQDRSADVLAELQTRLPYLRVVTHEANRGYGGALRSGFASATKELVFYTDGDGQYDPAELAALHAELTPELDVIQGWKSERSDGLHRKLIGSLYQHFTRFAFGLSVRDVDCDFRLIRRRVLEAIPLTCDSGCITVELVARIERAGFAIRELPVHHYPRQFGRSQFFNVGRIWQTLWQLAGLWLRLELGDRAAPILTPLPPAGSEVVPS